MPGGKTAVYSAGRRRAVFEPKTALWAARMLVGEGYKGGKGAAVLWALMVRYMNMPHRWSSFLHLMREFSQPINDRWMPGGDLFEATKRKKDDLSKRATSPAAVRRRKWIRSLSWQDIPNEAKTIVQQFARGVLPYPRRFKGNLFNNFASYPGLSDKYPGGVFYGKEYFFKDSDFKVKPITIRRDRGPAIVFDAKTLKPETAAGALAFIPIGIALYLLTKKQHKK